MNQLLSALYDILCFITEDAMAHGLMVRVPASLYTKMNELAEALGDYLDKNS